MAGHKLPTIFKYQEYRDPYYSATQGALPHVPPEFTWGAPPLLAGADLAAEARQPTAQVGSASSDSGSGVRKQK